MRARMRLAATMANEKLRVPGPVASLIEVVCANCDDSACVCGSLHSPTQQRLGHSKYAPLKEAQACLIEQPACSHMDSTLFLAAAHL